MSATKAGKRPLRSLTPLEKLNAITRVSVGGESKASVARDIGVPESTLRGWCKNHDKISNQVKAVSSPESSSLEEHPETYPVKRIKLEPSEEPYNLSMKASDASCSSYSPNSDLNRSLEEYPKPLEREVNIPLNLTKMSPTEKPTLAYKEKNRAELAKLSAEFGLNRPEFKPVFNRWVEMLNLCQQSGITKPPHISPTSTGGLLTPADKRRYQNRMEQIPSAYDNMSYWLRQQSYTNPNAQVSFLPVSSPSTSTSTNCTNTTSASTFLSPDSTNQMRLQMSLLYQQNYQIAQSLAAAAAASAAQSTPTQPILYQQLTKEPEINENRNQEDNKIVEDKPKNGTKRSVLDSLPVMNNNVNNNVNDNTKEDVEPFDAFEALNHGEKFLTWLENCSDPAVTCWQLNTVQSLMRNLRKSVEQRNHPSRLKNIRK